MAIATTTIQGTPTWGVSSGAPLFSSCWARPSEASLSPSASRSWASWPPTSPDPRVRLV